MSTPSRVRWISNYPSVAALAASISLVLPAAAHAQSGACCRDASCAVGSQADCVGVGGTYFGDGSTCEATLCPGAGACCTPFGCALVAPENCPAGLATFLGVGVPCTPDACVAPVTGACCLGPICLVQLSTFCNGDFLGEGTTCPPFCPLYACCMADGTCSTLQRTSCESQGGTPGDAASTCSPNTCPQPPQVCCGSMGSCQIIDAAACALFGGVIYTGTAVCTPNTCPGAPGACCAQTTCFVLAQATCNTFQGQYHGPGTVCGTTGNPVTCCPANFNHENGVTIQDIFDFLVAYFAQDAAADFNQSGSVGVQDIFDFLAAYFAGCTS